MTIEGVTVLSEKASTFTGVGVLLTVIGALSFIAFILGLIAGIKEKNRSTILISFICLFFVFLCTIGAIDRYTAKAHTYQVLIDDSVSFKEIDDKYIIENHDGQIYTLMERN